MRCINVDFPEPEGPTMQANSPSFTAKLTPSNAVSGGSPGLHLVTWSSSKTVARSPR
jgi:hypothetical protein